MKIGFTIFVTENLKFFIFLNFHFQEKDEHLELLEGMLIDLLKTKWNTFVKFRFYRQFLSFFCYFLVSLVCFTLRPGPPDRALNGTAINTTVGPLDPELVADVGRFSLGVSILCQFMAYYLCEDTDICLRIDTGRINTII